MYLVRFTFLLLLQNIQSHYASNIFNVRNSSLDIDKFSLEGNASEKMKMIQNYDKIDLQFENVDEFYYELANLVVASSSTDHNYKGVDQLLSPD